MLGNIEDDDVIRIISILIILGYLIFIALQIPIPELLNTMIGAVVGFYFHTVKTSLSNSSKVEKDKEDE